MERKDYVLEDERIVKVVVTCDEGQFTGLATCIPTDNFDVEKGKELAYKRALIQVKNADIAVFQKEIAESEEDLAKYKAAVIKNRRAKRKLKKATTHLSDIYRQIHEMNL